MIDSINTSLFQYDKPFKLESGISIPGFQLAYNSFGQFNPQINNVVWVFHALTGNSNPTEWWPGLVGDGKLFDPEKHFIICVNMPGSNYGSIQPLSVNPATNEPWYHDFPLFTTRDMIRMYQHLQQSLGIQKIHIGIGGSMGGQQLLEWAIEAPELFEYIFPMATNALHSAWGRAFNASQRFCIEVDATWKERNPKAGLEGMKAARAVALISYRHYQTYEKTQLDTDDEQLEGFKSESYQRYQGEKLAGRFNAFSYVALSKSMDAHNVGRGRNGVIEALHRIKAKTLVIGIDSDILYPVSEQAYIAENTPGAKLAILHSLYAHDGFLLEIDQLEKLITDFIND
jgi:homoserine O-acetyltransferase